MHTITIDSHAIYCSNPFKLSFKFYSHIHLITIIVPLFLDSELFLIIIICDHILIITIRKHNKFIVYSLFPYQYAIIFFTHNWKYQTFIV
jgi:hypothetical protein